MSASDLAISVRGVGKAYTIRHAAAHAPTTLGEAMLTRLKRPFASQGEKETFWALKDVSFDVKKGEVVGIIGRNGAGKSTLLKILSRITELTEGEVDLFGRVGSLLEVGTGFHQELTGRENIFLNGAILGMTRAEIRKHFDAIVDFAGVEKFLDTPVKRYSSGMYVRLAFAVAAHLRSEILIVDEVLAVGDAEFQKKCLGKMKEVSTDGRTVLFVSHNMATVEALCKGALTLECGRVSAVGSVNRCIEEYTCGLARSSHFNIDLRQLPRRPGHLPTISAVRIGELRQNRVSAIAIGDDLNIEVAIDAQPTLRSPVVGIGINTVTGVRLATVSTLFSGDQLPDVTGPTLIHCVIPSLQLLPGRYCLKVAVGAPHGDVDAIEHAAEFEVLPRKVSSTGVLPTSGQGWLYLPSHFSVESSHRSTEPAHIC